MMPVHSVPPRQSSQRVIVFDSGIGGFSILREIMRVGQPASIVYLCDQKNFPYGEKSAEWLEKRLAEIARWAALHDPAAFVIACNTGTVAGIHTVRSHLDCPVVGVEPAVKPLSSYESALVLATHRAVESERTQELLDIHGRHIRVYAPKGLATAIENNDTDQVKKSLQEIAAIVRRENVQAIGLSCTHYPLVQEQMQALFPKVQIYDPSEAVVRHLIKVLGTNHPEMPEEHRIEFMTTGEVIRLNEQIAAYFDGAYQSTYVRI